MNNPKEEIFLKLSGEGQQEFCDNPTTKKSQRKCFREMMSNKRNISTIDFKQLEASLKQPYEEPKPRTKEVQSIVDILESFITNVSEDYVNMAISPEDIPEIANEIAEKVK